MVHTRSWIYRWYCEILDERDDPLTLSVLICKMQMTIPASWVAVKYWHAVCLIVVPGLILFPIYSTFVMLISSSVSEWKRGLSFPYSVSPH